MMHLHISIALVIIAFIAREHASVQIVIVEKKYVPPPRELQNLTDDVLTPARARLLD